MATKNGEQARPTASDDASRGRRTRRLSDDHSAHVHATTPNISPVVCVKIARQLQTEKAIQ
jgi:hypothetical protein